MPGSWEIHAANRVLACVLHTDVTTIAWALGCRNLIIPGREDLRKFYPILPVSGMPYDHARNVAVQRMLDVGAEWWFGYDSDVIPPRDAISRLIARKKPIISGMYSRRSPPHAVPVMIRDGRWVTDFNPGSLVEVDLVGAGCLLIHREVFEKVRQRPEQGKPWFDWRVDMQGLEGLPEDLPPLSEDFTYCVAARRAGYKIIVDTSVRCRHVGYGEADYGTWKPLDTNFIM